MSDIARRRLLAAAAMIWLSALVVGAFIASRPEAGSVGYLISAVIYEVGSVICHQRPDRSFHVWSAQLPVCARCLGIYAGAAMTAMAAAITPFRTDRDSAPGRAMRAVLLAALPTALTLAYEWTTGVTPGNWTRAVAGFLLGATIAWVTSVASTPRPAVAIH